MVQTSPSNRQQFVSYMGCNSDRSIVTRGVPQGSILGPLLFLIFINDLPLSVNRSSLHMYADDQTLITKGKNLNEINTTVNSDIAPISNWMISNSMRINTTKTKYVLIATPQKLKSIANNRNDDLLSVYIAGSKISQVNCGSILGVSLDETLSWNSHVNRLCLTLSKRIGLIRRLRQFIPKQNRIVLYYGLIQSSLDYCIIVWGNTTECNIDKVFTLQKRLLRVLFELPYDFPSADLFNMFEVMSVRQRIFYFLAISAFNCFSQTAPRYLSDLFILNRNVNSYMTRSTALLNCYVPRFNLKVGQRSFRYRVVKVWNSLPADIK